MDPIEPIDPRERDLERIYRVERLRDERRRDHEDEERGRRRRPQRQEGDPPDDDGDGGHVIDVRV
jgi:hypothetical protein